jgi:lysophospholipase L1-like esterase
LGEALVSRRIPFRWRPTAIAFVAAALTVVAVSVIPSSADADPAKAKADPGPPPSSMAAVGDSITMAFDACGWFRDCPHLSWTTGTDGAVNSHFARIKAVNPAIDGHAYNDGETGADMADLNGQLQTAVSQAPGYVTILMGANDACTGSEAEMTPIDTFRSQLDQGLATLKAGAPDAKVLVASIPDIKRLWEVGKDSSSARTVWDIANICQSMLANPTSTDPADVARRDRVRQRVVDFNAQLADACAAYGSNCLFDGNAIFSYPFMLSQVSGWDYFHPNTEGQRVLAEVSYNAGFGW